MLRHILAALVFISLSVFCSNNCYATVVVDPSTGWRGEFAWFGGIGPVGIITPNEDELFSSDWSITTTTDCVMPFVTAYDGFAIGDEFALYVDGIQTAWSKTYADALGYFHGEYDSLPLTAGTHTLTFFVTALAPDLTEGSAFAEFSAAEPTPVPEPVTFVLLCTGVAALALRRRKNFRP